MVVIMVYPMYHVLVASLSDSNELVGQQGLMLWPKGFNTKAYELVASNPNIFSGYRTTLIVVFFGTLVNVLMTVLAAFLLTRKKFAIKNFIAYMAIFTMYFSGGMIPTYLVVFEGLHLGDSLWALILPTAISAYNMIIMRSGFASIPDSLEEAAKIDGANEYCILFRIMIPLALPTIAVMVLYYGVDNWNAWFNAMLYIRTRSKYPLQLVLREILFINSSGMAGGAEAADRYMIGESIKYATIIVATVPILVLYPFIQKYFVKGMMIGAVKG